MRTQELQNLRNTRSKAIGQAKAKGEDVAALLAEVAGVPRARVEECLEMVELRERADDRSRATRWA